MLPYMSCIMFLVIANKNLFLFSKCRASVLFARLSVPLVASRWRQRTLGELVQVHGREPGQPVKRSASLFPTERQLARREPGRTDSRSAVSEDGKKSSVQPRLPASVGGPQWQHQLHV